MTQTIPHQAPETTCQMCGSPQVGWAQIHWYAHRGVYLTITHAPGLSLPDGLPEEDPFHSLSLCHNGHPIPGANDAETAQKSYKFLATPASGKTEIVRELQRFQPGNLPDDNRALFREGVPAHVTRNYTNFDEQPTLAGQHNYTCLKAVSEILRLPENEVRAFVEGHQGGGDWGTLLWPILQQFAVGIVGNVLPGMIRRVRLFLFDHAGEDALPGIDPLAGLPAPIAHLESGIVLVLDSSLLLRDIPLEQARWSMRPTTGSLSLEQQEVTRYGRSQLLRNHINTRLNGLHIDQAPETILTLSKADLIRHRLVDQQNANNFGVSAWANTVAFNNNYNEQQRIKATRQGAAMAISYLATMHTEAFNTTLCQPGDDLAHIPDFNTCENLASSLLEHFANPDHFWSYLITHQMPDHQHQQFQEIGGQYNTQSWMAQSTSFEEDFQRSIGDPSFVSLRDLASAAIIGAFLQPFNVDWNLLRAHRVPVKFSIHCAREVVAKDGRLTIEQPANVFAEGCSQRLIQLMIAGELGA